MVESLVKLSEVASKSVDKVEKMSVKDLGNKKFDRPDFLRETPNFLEKYNKEFGDSNHKDLKDIYGPKILKEDVSENRTSIFEGTKLEDDYNKIIERGTIKLSDKDFNYLNGLEGKEAAQNLRVYIKHYGDGKNDFNNFFLRLDKEQAKTLLNNDGIKDYVNDRLRGGGGYHEWLMRKHYQDFLFNEKWGDDGKKLAYSVDKFKQRTENVWFKDGGCHGSENSATFHNGLSNAIEKANNSKEVISNINDYAKEKLTPESYKEFSEIVDNVFVKMNR